MKNLIISTPTMHDAPAFYRTAGPFSELRKRTSDINYLFMQDGSQWTWSTVAMGDAFLMQRPYRRDHLEIAKMIKDQGKPLWVDYDDDLFTVPMDNPNHETFTHPECHKIMEAVLKAADIVTVSTQSLGQKFKSFNKNVCVIPNAFDHEMFKHIGDFSKKREKIILWRGSKTHMRDLLEHKDKLLKIINQFKDWQWYFLGFMPFFIADEIKEQDRVFHVPDLEIIKYHQFIHKLKAAITIVPLTDSEFNRSKSNCAWLESTFAGNAVISSPLPEWQVRGIYATPDFNDLIGLMKNQEHREDLVKSSVEEIHKNFSLAKHNDTRLKIMRELLK